MIPHQSAHPTSSGQKTIPIRVYSLSKKNIPWILNNVNIILYISWLHSNWIINNAVYMLNLLLIKFFQTSLCTYRRARNRQFHWVYKLQNLMRQIPCYIFLKWILNYFFSVWGMPKLCQYCFWIFYYAQFLLYSI